MSCKVFLRERSGLGYMQVNGQEPDEKLYIKYCFRVLPMRPEIAHDGNGQRVHPLYPIMLFGD